MENDKKVVIDHDLLAERIADFLVADNPVIDKKVKASPTVEFTYDSQRIGYEELGFHALTALEVVQKSLSDLDRIQLHIAFRGGQSDALLAQIEHQRKSLLEAAEVRSQALKGMASG